MNYTMQSREKNEGLSKITAQIGRICIENIHFLL